MKAFFDDTVPLASMTDIVQASSDGLSLTQYTGPDRNRITIGGEMDKVAANIGIGRNHAECTGGRTTQIRSCWERLSPSAFCATRTTRTTSRSGIHIYQIRRKQRRR